MVNQENQIILTILKENMENNGLSLDNFYLYNDSRISGTSLYLINNLYDNENLNSLEKTICQALIESMIKTMENVMNPQFEIELISEVNFTNRIANLLPKCSAEKREEFQIKVLAKIDTMEKMEKKSHVKINYKSH